MHVRNAYPVARRYVGLRNLGNSCYMNSVLQLLWTLPPLAKRYVEPALGVFRSAPPDPAADFATQVCTTRHAHQITFRAIGAGCFGTTLCCTRCCQVSPQLLPPAAQQASRRRLSPWQACSHADCVPSARARRCRRLEWR